MQIIPLVIHTTTRPNDMQVGKIIRFVRLILDEFVTVPAIPIMWLAMRRI
jgi:hypothetical protein